MPELPEVETIARQLRARGLVGGRIDGVEVMWPPTIGSHSVDQFISAVAGSRLEAIERYGKWLILRISRGASVMVHLRMSGSFSFEKGRHARLVLTFGDGRVLYFHDPRKFGRWHLVDDPQVILAALGPDALTDDFCEVGFASSLRGRRRVIKALLLDQSIVAGVGNIYADEALWEAEIHPRREGSGLSDAEVSRLYKAIRLVLRVGVENRGTSLGAGKSNYKDVNQEVGGNREAVKAYGRAGLACYRCRGEMKRLVVAQRSSHYCPFCQLV
jgi:formamidopyrimidine-DNA glycosylase